MKTWFVVPLKHDASVPCERPDPVCSSANDTAVCCFRKLLFALKLSFIMFTLHLCGFLGLNSATTQIPHRAAQQPHLLHKLKVFFHFLNAQGYFCSSKNENEITVDVL